jgi:hypothetical protein
MDNFFPNLYDNLWNIRIKQDMSCGLESKNLKWSNNQTRIKGDLKPTLWKDKRIVHMLTNMHNPPAKGNIWDEHGNIVKMGIPE